MELSKSTDFHHQSPPDRREKIEHVLQQLSVATDLCSKRKEQITPLINAFAKATEAPTKP
jgi:hypothetical protein